MHAVVVVEEIVQVIIAVVGVGKDEANLSEKIFKLNFQ